MEENDGAWNYRPRPRGLGDVDFKLVQAGDDYVEFANPEHDFPQRIVYRRVTPDTLEITVSAPWADKGTEPGKGFSYRLQRRR